MNVVDINVIEQAVEWLQNNRTAWLCTIVSTYGSSARPLGSLFLTDGVQRVGSISGGCIEDRFVKALYDQQFKDSVSIYIYGKQQKEGMTVELPCGGSISLLIEKITAGTHASQMRMMHKNLVAGNSIQRIINITRQTSVTEMGDPHAEKVTFLDDIVSVQYQKSWSLLVVGASAVSEQVVTLGLQLGHQVKVIDTRDVYIDNWTHETIKADLVWPDDYVLSEDDHQYTAVLALSHHPTLDDAAISIALETNAYYIGAMGSRATSEKRKLRLQKIEGISDKQLERLHAPIGMNLGGKTPVEIALSIMADVTRVQYGIEQSQIWYDII